MAGFDGTFQWNTARPWQSPNTVAATRAMPEKRTVFHSAVSVSGAVHTCHSAGTSASAHATVATNGATLTMPNTVSASATATR